MRIIAGTLRGRQVNIPSGIKVRPTSDKVKESIFSALSSIIDIDGKQVLDLFSGSGSVGLEFVSRGASHVTFVDINPKYTIENIKSLKAENSATIIACDIRRLKVKEPFDIIFADPPYGLRLISKVLEKAEVLGRQGTIWVLESEKAAEFKIDSDAFEILKQVTYGDIKVSFLEQL